jgi:hypothetical protein
MHYNQEDRAIQIVECRELAFGETRNGLNGDFQVQ